MIKGRDAFTGIVPIYLKCVFSRGIYYLGGWVFHIIWGLPYLGHIICKTKPPPPPPPPPKKKKKKNKKKKKTKSCYFLGDRQFFSRRLARWGFEPATCDNDLFRNHLNVSPLCSCSNGNETADHSFCECPLFSD